MLVKVLILASFFNLIVGEDIAENVNSNSDKNNELLTNLLNGTKNALIIYDQSIPSEYLSNAINVMGLDLNDYSSGAVNHVTNAGQSIRLGLDKSDQENRKVFGWAVYTKSSLESYLQVINLTNFTDTTVIFETIDRSLNLFTNVIAGFDIVLSHFSNAVGELESLKNQLGRDKTVGSSFLTNALKAIRIESNFNSPQISTFAGVFDFLQRIQICKCKDMLNVVGFTLDNEVQFKSQVLSQRLDLIETMYNDITNEIVGIIANIRDFKQKLEHEINLMREYENQMEYNSVNFRDFPIVKDIHGPIIKNLIDNCEDYIQTQNSDNNLH